MCISSKLLSHPHQTLQKHIDGVLEIALMLHRLKGGEETLEPIITTICKAHDFAKATSFFQAYIRGGEGSSLKNHGLLSALYAFSQLPVAYKLMGFLIVKKHHGDMEDANFEVQIRQQESQLVKQVQDIYLNNLEQVQEIYGIEVAQFLQVTTIKSLIREVIKSYRKGIPYTVAQSIELNYLYSLLLTGDKMQLIKGQFEISNKKYSANLVEAYKDKIIQALPTAVKQTDLFMMRQDLFTKLQLGLKKINVLEDYFLNIHVPTGGGKTILAYYAALDLAARKNGKGKTSQIIYALPFMSVIDQNYEVLEEILGEEHLSSQDILKYHSLTEVKYEDYTEYDARFLMDNWQSQIITTTFVQLFNTLFKFGDQGTVHRLYNLANAVVILDEVQAIPPKYYPMIKQVFQILGEVYHTTFILVSATLPILIETKPLIATSNMYFEAMNRITMKVHLKQPYQVEEFSEYLIDQIIAQEEKSFLIVLNTVSSAKQVAKTLQEGTSRRVILLTTEIYPKLRLQKIKEIKAAKEKLVIVSTQLIEAGVDIDLDIIYRDLAPFDCIQQAAGRANRNGGENKGIVHVVKLLNDSERPLANMIYSKVLLEITEGLLQKETYMESEFLEIATAYYEEIKRRSSTQIAEELSECLEKLAFASFREQFELIPKENYKEDVFICSDEEAEQLIVQLQEQEEFGYLELINIFRRLNQYRVGVSKKELNGERTIPCEMIERFHLQFIRREDYNEDEGIIRTHEMIF